MPQTTTPLEQRHRGLAPQTTFLLVLTFAAGAVDALSLAGVDGVFAANQTGNVVFAPLGLAGWEVGVRLGAALVALSFFVGGALLAARLLPSSPTSQVWGPPALAVTAVHLVLMLAALAVWATAGLSEQWVRFGVTALLASGMGIQAATARRIAIPGLPTVMLTGVLLGLSVESPRSISARRRWAHEIGSLATMAGGALAAAFALKVSVGLAFAVAVAAVSAAVLVVAETIRRDRRGP